MVTRWFKPSGGFLEPGDSHVEIGEHTQGVPVIVRRDGTRKALPGLRWTILGVEFQCRQGGWTELGESPNDVRKRQAELHAEHD